MTSTDRWTSGRTTRQRRAVSAVLDDLDGFRSAQEIHDTLKRRGEAVGLSTVYRTLQAMAESGDVDVLRADDGEARYRQCSSGHHHHLVCRDCGRVVEFVSPLLVELGRELQDAHGFRVNDLEVEITATCGACPALASEVPSRRHLSLQAGSERIG